MSAFAEADALLRQIKEREAKAETLKPGDKARFFTLYGYRTVVVKRVTRTAHPTLPDDSDLMIQFDPIQIGPEDGFGPTDHWAVRSGMQRCEKVE